MIPLSDEDLCEALQGNLNHARSPSLICIQQDYYLVIYVGTIVADNEDEEDTMDPIQLISDKHMFIDANTQVVKPLLYK